MIFVKTGDLLSVGPSLVPKSSNFALKFYKFATCSFSMKHPQESMSILLKYLTKEDVWRFSIPPYHTGELKKKYKRG